MDIRQSPQWGKFLSQIGWTTEKVGPTQVMVRQIPFIGRSVIKVQRPKNPVPLTEIDLIAKKHKAFFALIEPEIDKYEEEEFLKYQYQKSILSLTCTATIYIDLTKSEEEIFAGFGENAKRNIKKAQKHKLKVKTVLLKNTKDDREFKKFYRLQENLTKIKKFYNPGFTEFYKKMVAFKDKSILLFAYTDLKKEPIGAVWVCVLKGKMSYLHTGIAEEGYKLMANYLLVWEALKVGKQLNLNVFDFEGIFDPRFPKERKTWIKFSQFKQRFHGTTIQYPPPWIKCYSLIYKLLYLCNKIFYR